MFKHELPLMFPDDADVKAVADAMFDPFEYLVLRDRDGLLRKDFKTPLGKVELSRPVPFARAEHRAENARSARMDPRDDGQHGRALRRPRRDVRREARVLRELDEDRQARVQPDG